jgi:hypothetical protein
MQDMNYVNDCGASKVYIYVKKFGNLGCYSLLPQNLIESSRSAGKSENQGTKPN